jgi:hypothetical protein
LVLGCLHLLAVGSVLPAEDDEEAVVEEGDYIRAGDILYRTEWKPRDCIGMSEKLTHLTI